MSEQDKQAEPLPGADEPQPQRRSRNPVREDIHSRGEELYDFGIPDPKVEDVGRLLTGPVFENEDLTLKNALDRAFSLHFPPRLPGGGPLLGIFNKKLSDFEQNDPAEANKPFDGTYETLQDGMKKLGLRHCVWLPRYFGRNWCNSRIEEAELPFNDKIVFWVPIGTPLLELLKLMKPTAQVLLHEIPGVDQVRVFEDPAVAFVDLRGTHVRGMGPTITFYMCKNGLLPHECQIQVWEPLSRADRDKLRDEYNIWLDDDLTWEEGDHLGCRTFRGTKRALVATPAAAPGPEVLRISPWVLLRGRD
jgi:hypothetical protein